MYAAIGVPALADPTSISSTVGIDPAFQLLADPTVVADKVVLAFNKCSTFAPIVKVQLSLDTPLAFVEAAFKTVIDGTPPAVDSRLFISVATAVGVIVKEGVVPSSSILLIVVEVTVILGILVVVPSVTTVLKVAPVTTVFAVTGFKVLFVAPAVSIVIVPAGVKLYEHCP